LELYTDSINSHESFSKGTHLKTPIVFLNQKWKGWINRCLWSHQGQSNKVVITISEKKGRRLRTVYHGLRKASGRKTHTATRAVLRCSPRRVESLAQRVHQIGSKQLCLLLLQHPPQSLVLKHSYSYSRRLNPYMQYQHSRGENLEFSNWILGNEI
jgi:hypothetical protein